MFDIWSCRDLKRSSGLLTEDPEATLPTGRLAAAVVGRTGGALAGGALVARCGRRVVDSAGALGCVRAGGPPGLRRLTPGLASRNGCLAAAVEFSGIDASLFLGGFVSSSGTNLRFTPPAFILNVNDVEGTEGPGSLES